MMLKVIKEIGIFIVIAQAILYLVPGENYVKYVKVIIGIIIIAQIARPFMELGAGGVYEEILWESRMLAEQMPDTSETFRAMFEMSQEK